MAIYMYHLHKHSMSHKGQVINEYVNWISGEITIERMANLMSKEQNEIFKKIPGMSENLESWACHSWSFEVQP